MTYISPTYARLETPLGALLMWSNGTSTADDGRTVDTLSLRTEGEHNRYEGNAPEGGWDGVAESVAINRVDWRLHTYVHLDPDTGEVLAFDPNTYGALNRADWKEPTYDSKSKAQRKMEDALRPAIEAFVRSDAGKALLRRGRYVQANNARDDHRKTIANLEAELTAAQSRLSATEAAMEANA